MKVVGTYKLIARDKRYAYEAKIPKGAKVLGCHVSELDGIQISAVVSDKHKLKDRRFLVIPSYVGIPDYDSKHYEYVGSVMWCFATVYVFEVHE